MSSWRAAAEPSCEDQASSKPTSVPQGKQETVSHLNDRQGELILPTDARKQTINTMTYAQALRNFPHREDRSVAATPEKGGPAKLLTTLPINYLQESLHDEHRGSDTSLDSRVVCNDSSLVRTTSTASWEDIDIPELPLFIAEHQIAWDHKMCFSQLGREFGISFASLHRDYVPVVHDLLKRTHPAKARELEIEYAEDPGWVVDDIEQRKPSCLNRSPLPQKRFSIMFMR